MRDPLRLTRTVPPAQLPVTLGEVKAHLRIEDRQSDDDPVIMAHLRAAVDHCEQVTGRALITQTWIMVRDAWPWATAPDGSLIEGLHLGAELREPARAVDLARPPLQGVVAVKIFDDGDGETVWPVSKYFVDTRSQPGRLVARSGVTFPVPGRAANGIEIEFVAGYGDDIADVPDELRQGILRLAAHLYEHRGDDIDSAARASGAVALWQPHRMVRL